MPERRQPPFLSRTGVGGKFFGDRVEADQRLIRRQPEQPLLIFHDLPDGATGKAGAVLHCRVVMGKVFVVRAVRCRRRCQHEFGQAAIGWAAKPKVAVAVLKNGKDAAAQSVGCVRRALVVTKAIDGGVIAVSAAPLGCHP